MWIDLVTPGGTPGSGGTQEEWEAFDEGHRLHLNFHEGTAFPILSWKDDMAPWPVVRAVPHQGRIVVFLSNGTAFERDTDGSWSRYKVARGSGFCYGYKGGFAASVLLG